MRRGRKGWVKWTGIKKSSKNLPSRGFIELEEKKGKGETEWILNRNVLRQVLTKTRLQCGATNGKKSRSMAAIEIKYLGSWPKRDLGSCVWGGRRKLWQSGEICLVSPPPACQRLTYNGVAWNDIEALMSYLPTLWLMFPSFPHIFAWNIVNILCLFQIEIKKSLHMKRAGACVAW